MNIKNSKIALSIVIILFIATIYMISIICHGGSFAIDGKAADSITGIFKHPTFPFFETVSNLGDKIGIGSVALIFLFWLLLKKKDYVGMAAFVFSIALGNEFNKIIKEAISRPRPTFNHFVDAENMSFPSGHAMVGFILYMFIAYLLIQDMKSKIGKGFIVIGACLILLLIGISRIVLGFHYATDIIAGYFIGAIWLFLWISLYEVFKRRFNK
ncbi:phosphatase PAP2 family protein [Niallia sp. 03133]|uniref:phosphatase PAP2 family protein n=1 Tax=Niallia sp. 03133 TaxID=3458060 RepID=UPI004044B0C9